MLRALDPDPNLSESGFDFNLHLIQDYSNPWDMLEKTKELLVVSPFLSDEALQTRIKDRQSDVTYFAREVAQLDRDIKDPLDSEEKYYLLEKWFVKSRQFDRARRRLEAAKWLQERRVKKKSKAESRQSSNVIAFKPLNRR